MSRRGARRWALILLPGLLLRSLTPIGFMPMFGPGLSVGLMLCPGYVPVRAASRTAADTSMHMAGMDMSRMDTSTDVSMAAPEAQQPDTPSGPEGPARTDHQEHTLCLYTASATHAALPCLDGVSTPAHGWTQATARVAAQVAEFQRLPRAQTARAPPLPS